MLGLEPSLSGLQPSLNLLCAKASGGGVWAKLCAMHANGVAKRCQASLRALAPRKSAYRKDKHTAIKQAAGFLPATYISARFVQHQCKRRGRAAAPQSLMRPCQPPCRQRAARLPMIEQSSECRSSHLRRPSHAQALLQGILRASFPTMGVLPSRLTGRTLKKGAMAYCAWYSCMLLLRYRSADRVH